MKTENTQIAVFAGGCFWCTEAVFVRLKGVHKVISGYTGGFIKNPPYREVCQGRTGHAEGVEISFDPSVISYQTLLEVFFATHDPTTLNRQGNDVGTQYRSEIFYTNKEQRDVAEHFIQALESEHVFDGPIVTAITPFEVFYPAEQEHQDYYENHTEQPYCQIMISPKIKKIQTYFKDHITN